jgi:hypothetical protein
VRVEERLQIEIFQYLAWKYPDVIAISEPSGLRVSMGLATKLKKMRSKHTHCDLYLLEPRGKYSGLILELKAKNIYKRDGTLYKDEHLEDQQRTINLLNEKGYYATFAVGFDQSIKIIEDYLNNRL